MSQILGVSGWLLLPNDRRIFPEDRVPKGFRPRTAQRYDEEDMPGGYRAGHWPAGGGLFGLLGASDIPLQAVSQPIMRVAFGAGSRYGIVGFTRNQYGTPLAGCTCSLFRVSNKAWIMDAVSDANGYFVLQTWYYPDTHFIVFYKTGSPNVFGTTDWDVIGA